MKKAFTLVELIITIALFALLATVTVYVFRAVLLSWSSSEERVGVDIVLDRGIEEITRDLREAKEVNDNYDGDGTKNDEIRFTLDESTYYIYYLYNASDSYVPPPAFNQTSYELKKTTLTGGDINGTFTYGDGKIIISDIIPPGAGSDPKTDLSIDANNLITIILKVTRDDETITSKTQVMPRNL